ncbi:MAG: ATP-dependent 6-phosphofructokinase [Planctomycetota bacterium]
MSKPIRRIAVNTGGGDAPGLNAVIRAVVLSSLRRGWEVVGIRKGYDGLLEPDKCVRLDRESVRGITHLGGTILGTTNRGNPFNYPVRSADGTEQMVDRFPDVIRNFRELGLDALVAIGGDGSMRIAHRLAEGGMPIVGVPKTIDNDLASTLMTFGFDTAVSIATDALDRLHSTAEAHERVLVVEVMGRHAGWIALHAGVAATADAILIPEIPYDLEAVAAKIAEREANGRLFSIVVVAEGALPRGGTVTTKGSQEAGREVRLGGVGERCALQLEELTGKEARCVVLGHLQRGGRPTTFDRLLALRFGAAAVRFVEARTFGTMAALAPPRIQPVPLAQAIAERKQVPLDCDTVMTARDLGICLGDRV